jgi:gliding motility-associated-like protein
MDVVRGRTYCYRVVALMVRRTPGGGPIYEEIESIPSEEVCVQLARDIPLLTKVDVTETSTTDGEIDVCWILPQANSLDTIQNPGPYRYVLSRASGQTTDPAAFVAIQSYETQFFGDRVPTCYTDENLDTEGSAYSYRIELFTDGDNEPIGDGQPASSVRLGGQPTDRAAELSWTELVPWTNTSYEVFRRLPGEDDFELVATVAEPTYRDDGLENGEEYCYYIRSTGSYNVDDIPSPLLNRSQVLCLIAEDNVAPCVPALVIESVCDREVDCSDDGNLFNLLRWSLPAETCEGNDVAGYRIYFASDSSTAPEMIAQIDSDDILSFQHTPPTGIVGCYSITAFDANNNESEQSAEVCVTNCPVYELPNVFTPNGDQANDLLRPRVFCFVERVELKIFNRWGQLVFQTEDPSIEWDGTNLQGEPLPSSTYFYVAQVYERRLDGVVPSQGKISGYIELITNR